MRLLLLFLVALTLAACDSTTADSNVATVRSDAIHAEAHQIGEPDAIAEIRRATARYHRVERADADGYGFRSECVAATLDDGTEIAAMGFHHVKFDLIFDGTIDPAAPEILLYEPMKNGKLRLVGVEFMVDAESWEGDAPPSFEGVEFAAHLDASPEGNTHGIPFPHYDLHVWTWKNNPDGMFMPMNPTVSCAYDAPAS